MKNHNKIRPLRIALTVFVIAVLLFSTAVIVNKYMPNLKAAPYFEELGLDSEKIYIELEDKLIKLNNNPIEMDNEIYIPVDFIKQYVDEYIFWDKETDKLIITTANNVIRMKSDDLTYFVNNEPMDLFLPVYNIDGVAYLPENFLQELYDVSIVYTNGLVMVDYSDKASKVTTVKARKANLRYAPDKKSAISKKVVAGDALNVYEYGDVYSRVRTADGYIGYILTKHINEPAEIGPVIKPADEDAVIWKPAHGKINMVFDQITTVAGNRNANKRIYHKGLDVISPTWFSFMGENGDIACIADKGYVSWAHANGYQVWALITDNFNSDICHAVISDTDTREHVIKQLLAFASLYDLDGINIDFEAVPKKDGEYYIQFLRELAPMLRQQGVILSVDMFVPKPWTAHYNRKEAAKIVDYVIVMGYDEHYAGSEVSGSVASIGWSREAIESTLKEEVPPEKLILGIPFYTRVWTESLDANGKISLSSKAYGMDGAFDFMYAKSAEITWLEDKAQYYGEATEGNTTYKVWLEEMESLERRLKLVNEYDIAGTAAWKRGLEREEAWDILYRYLKD